MIKNFLYRMLLPCLLAKACESRIPRSGKKGEQVNCYVVALDQGDSPYFVATSIEGDVLAGLKYDGNSYAEKAMISISDLKDGTLRISHYYGLSQITYLSIYDLAFHHFTRLIYIKIRIYRYIDTTFQYFFNKRKLVSKKRMDLLSFMMDGQLDRTHKGISALSLLRELFSIRLFQHPSFDVQYEKLKLYLDSLVASGEIKKNNDEYEVTGKAIITLEKYEEEERRHTEAVKLQRKMFWLALIALIFAIVQTGLIKLPTLMDFTNSSNVETPHNKATATDAKSRAADFGVSAPENI